MCSQSVRAGPEHPLGADARAEPAEDPSVGAHERGTIPSILSAAGLALLLACGSTVQHPTLTNEPPEASRFRIRHYRVELRVSSDATGVTVSGHEGIDVEMRGSQSIQLDAIDIIKWKDIYGDLEKATDSCSDVANVVESIVIRHS